MPKIYIVYCCILLIALATASSAGIVFGSLFYAGRAVGSAGNHYHK